MHISTAGWLDYVYGLTPDDNFYNLSLDVPYSYPAASVTAVFSTNSYIDTPFTTLLNYNQRAYELGFGGNYGGVLGVALEPISHRTRPAIFPQKTAEKL